MEKPAFTREIIELQGMRFQKRAAIHRFSLPGGEGRWESFFIPESDATVVVAAFTASKKMIVVKMFRFPVEDWVFELPGGGAEPGEALDAAAKRELLEETGYTTDEPLQEIGGGWLFNAGINADFRIFFAKNCRRVQSPVLDEVEKLAQLEVIEATPDEIMEKISQGEKGYDPILSHALVCLRGRGIW